MKPIRDIDRSLDILKQGFAKPLGLATQPKPRKLGDGIVACRKCRNWHPKGKHIKMTTKEVNMKSGRMTVIEARRVAGNLYDCTSPDSTLAEQLTWEGLCSLAQSAKIDTVHVTNGQAGPGELPKITYHPSREYPLSQMVRPSMASTEVVGPYGPGCSQR